MNGLADGSIKAKDGKEYSSKILGGQNPLSMYCAGVETLDPVSYTHLGGTYAPCDTGNRRDGKLSAVQQGYFIFRFQR